MDIKEVKKQLEAARRVEDEIRLLNGQISKLRERAESTTRRYAQLLSSSGGKEIIADCCIGAADAERRLQEQIDKLCAVAHIQLRAFGAD